MAASGDVIQSFLVGLGFDVDESSLAVFNKAIATAALRVTALYTSINAFAASMVYAFSKISEGFEEMGYQYHIIAPAINKAIVLRQELLKAYGAAGINIRKTIVDSVKLNMSLTKTKFAMEAIYKSVGSRFFGLLQKQSDAFRKRLYENMPYIIDALEKLVKGVFNAFDMVTRLGMRLWSVLSRVYDFFAMLDKATDGWSTTILSVIAAWKLLNLSFLATPLGKLLLIGGALLELYDDYKTFLEGGESLIDWGDRTNQILGIMGATVLALVPVIMGVKKAFDAWSEAKKTIQGVYTAVNSLATIFGITAGSMGAILILLGLIAAAGYLVYKNWDLLTKKVNDFIDSVKRIPQNLLKAFDLASDFWNIPGYKPGPQQLTPLGSTPPPGQSNVNANMQTSINITGSPNPDATARAAAREQQNVNRDFSRNMRGATR